METTKKSTFGLTNNQLKIIAMVSMLFDHVGEVLFYNQSCYVIFKIIGRLAFPIFAFMIAEGCRYTKNRTRYLLTIAGLGIAFQAVYYVFTQSWYIGILLTFTLSILLFISPSMLYISNIDSVNVNNIPIYQDCVNT